MTYKTSFHQTTASDTGVSNSAQNPEYIIRIDIVQKEVREAFDKGNAVNKDFTEEETKGISMALEGKYKYFYFANYCVFYRYGHYPKLLFTEKVEKISNKDKQVKFTTPFQRAYNSLAKITKRNFYIFFPKQVTFSDKADGNLLVRIMDGCKKVTGDSIHINSPSSKLIYKYESSKATEFKSQVVFPTMLNLISSHAGTGIEVMDPIGIIIGVPPYYLNTKGCNLYVRVFDKFAVVYDPSKYDVLPDSLLVLNNTQTETISEHFIVAVDNYLTEVIPLQGMSKTKDLLEWFKKGNVVPKSDLEIDKLIEDDKIEAIFDQGNSLRIIQRNDEKAPNLDVYKLYLVNFPSDIDMSALFHLFDNYSPLSIEAVEHQNYFILYVEGKEQAKRIKKDFPYNIETKQPMSKDQIQFTTSKMALRSLSSSKTTIPAQGIKMEIKPRTEIGKRDTAKSPAISVEKRMKQESLVVKKGDGTPKTLGFSSI